MNDREKWRLLVKSGLKKAVQMRRAESGANCRHHNSGMQQLWKGLSLEHCPHKPISKVYLGYIADCEQSLSVPQGKKMKIER